MAAPPPSEPPSWVASPPPEVAAAPPEVEPPQLWNTPIPASRSRMWIYMSGVVLIVVIATAGLGIYGLLHSGSGIQQLHAPPSPLISDYDRADRFLIVDLGPALAETNQAMPAVSSQCTASLPPACKDALITLNKAMLDLNDAMTNNQRDIPPCIGRQVQQFKDDWQGMEQGVSMAIGGYDANSRALIVQGLQRFASIAQYMKADVDRIGKAQQTCSRTV
jgi:hypothetical protein